MVKKQWEGMKAWFEQKEKRIDDKIEEASISIRMKKSLFEERKK